MRYDNPELELSPNGNRGFHSVGKSQQRAITRALLMMAEDPSVTVVHLYATYGGFFEDGSLMGGNRRFRGYIDPDGRLRKPQ